MTFTLPEIVGINKLDRNWDKQFLAKFKIASENGTEIEAIGEFAKFIANNRNQIEENLLMLFLRKINDNFNIDDFQVQRTISAYENWLNGEKNKSEINPDIETKDSTFHKSVKFIHTNYVNVYVNSMTNEIMFEKEDVHRKLDVETLFTDLSFENITVQPKKIFSYLYSKKYTRHINPVLNILERTDYKPGDPDFIGQVLGYLKFENLKVNFDLQQFYRNMFEKWLVRCIENAIDDDSIPNKQVFILKGLQNARKTSFIRWLYHPFREYALDNLSINPNEIKTKKALTSNMFIFNDEIDKMSDKELQKFKIVTSDDYQKFRPNQHYTEKLIKRRANFVSSTNKMKFLTDLTGSIRYIILEIVNDQENPISADLLNNKELSLLMWGQAYALYKEGRNFYNAQLTSDETLKIEKLNQRYYSYRNLDEAIQNLYPESHSETDDSVMMNASELLEHIRHNANFPKNLISGKTSVAIGRILKNNLHYRQYSDRGKSKNPTYRYKFKIDSV